MGDLEMADAEKKVDVCPDVKLGQRCENWHNKTPQIPDNIDVVAWMQAELTDGWEHEMAHKVYGPGLFGHDDNGDPYFEVYRDDVSKDWVVRAKEGVINE